MKKLIAILIATALLLTLSISAFATETSTITVGSTTAAVGEEITLEVTVDSIEMAAFGLTIEYDAEGLELTAIKKGDALKIDDFEDAGFVRNVDTGIIAFYNVINGETSGVLFTMTFTVLADGEHNVHLEIDSFNKADQSEVAVTAVDGTVSVHTHDYVANVVEPTCTEQGYTEYTCSCGDSYIDEESYVDATGHTFGEWTVVTEPTCEENGEKTRECACGHTETEAIEATGHSFVDGVCENCGAEDVNPETGYAGMLALASISVLSLAAVVVTAKKKAE